MKTLYHFTSSLHLPKILASGALLPTESNIHPYQPHAGPDVVWLLDTPEVEFDHGLTYPLEHPAHGSGVSKSEIRFEVSSPLAVKWSEWAWLLRMEKGWRDTLVEAAGGEEAADHWYVLPGRIPASRWASVTETATGRTLVIPEGGQGEVHWAEAEAVQA